MITYVDASVLLRIVLGETDPLASWQEVQPVSSELLRVECLRVLDRARLAFQHDDRQSAGYRIAALEAIRTFGLAPLTNSVLERASNPFPTSLGTLDAIHLATAIQVREDYQELQFATHDAELATAARAVGFIVLGA